MLGHKNYSKMIDNKLGHKLTFPINSLGSKIVKFSNHNNHHNVEHHEPKVVKSFLEKR